MNLQQYYRYDSTLLGLNDVYIELPDNSFYINSDCIHTFQHTVWTGKTYVLKWSLSNGGFELETVKVIDVYCDNIRINLDLMDVLTHKQFTLNFNFHEKYECTWRLLEVDLWSDDDLLEIEEFCECN